MEASACRDRTEPLLIQTQWKTGGKGRNTATLLVYPWLAYGCSVGARLVTDEGFATVSAINADDMCELIIDNDTNAAGDTLGSSYKPVVLIDPRPDTAQKTTSPNYKTGQRLLLVLDGVYVDAVVASWKGRRFGSRHVVGIRPPPDSSGNERWPQMPNEWPTTEVDLNEENHAMLLFKSVMTFREQCASYLVSTA